MTPSKTWLIASAALAVAVFALMWIGFALNWAWLAAIDSSTLDMGYDYAVGHPGWVTAWNVFCTVLGPTAFRLVALGWIVFALMRRNVRVAMFLVISVELAGIITEIAKYVANRPRPATALVHALSTSFPSGHALGVMVGVLALLTIVLPVVGRPARVCLITLGAIVVVAIGIGRVVLNVHHLSDVVAGWALGYAYFVACLLLVPPSRPVTVTDETPAAIGTSR
ncbi:phosphatase PAP2 family protein [Mycobacterium sp. NPDC048908]|uniref:phosphatase PAP2 family protein n=1 Tax=Mycobacterium sp. NPDC048908 TaxID=3364292 RepID=UPI00370FB702